MANARRWVSSSSAMMPSQFNTSLGKTFRRYTITGTFDDYTRKTSVTVRTKSCIGVLSPKEPVPGTKAQLPSYDYGPMQSQIARHYALPLYRSYPRKDRR